MASVGSLSVDLIANTASFNSNLEKAAAQLNSNASKMTKSLAAVEAGAKRLGTALRIAEVVAVAREFGELVKSNLEYVASIGVTAKQVGVTAEQLQVYRFAAQQAGVSQDDLERGLQKLTVATGKASLGSEKQTKVLTALNLPLKDAAGHSLTTAQRMEQLADKFSKMHDQGQKGAVAVELFSRSGMKMIPILDKGSQGLRDLGDEAQKAGLIISDTLVEQAHAAEVAIAKLNAELKTSIAKEVAQNAQSIYGLANALSHLTIEAITFIGKYPALAGALAGAAAGAVLTKSPIGAVIGAGAGFIAGQKVGRVQADSNMDLTFRSQELARATKEMTARLNAQKSNGPLITFRHSNADGGDFNAAVAEVHRQAALTHKAAAVAREANVQTPAAPSLPDFLSGKGPKAKKPPREKKDPLADADLRFGEELAQIDDEILQVKRSSLTDVDAIANIDKDIVVKEIARKDLAIQKEVRDKHITDVQGKQLVAENDLLAKAKTAQIDTDAKAEKLHRSNELQLAINDNDLGLLRAQEQFAATGAERLRIGLAILDEEKKQERIKLQQTIDDAKLGKATAEQAAAAQDALNKLDKRFALEAEAQKQQNAGPLEAYLRDLHRTPEQLNAAIGQIKVDGLTALTDGLVDAIVNFRSLADVAQNVVKTVLAELLKLQIEKTITGPLAAKLFPGEARKGAELAASAAAAAKGGDLTVSASALTNAATGLTTSATQLQSAAASLSACGTGAGLGSLGASNDNFASDLSAKIYDFGSSVDNASTLLGTGLTSSIDATSDALSKQVLNLDTFGNGLNSVLSSLSSGKGGGGFLGSILKLGASAFGGGISAGAVASLTPDVLTTIAANPAIFKDGGYLGGFADGGLLSGPGTGTSDSILAHGPNGKTARFSNGEFIVNAAAVKRLGVPVLDKLNKGLPFIDYAQPQSERIIDKAKHSPLAPMMPGFAAGGLLGKSSESTGPAFASGGFVGRMPTFTLPPMNAPGGGAGNVFNTYMSFPNVRDSREARETTGQAARNMRREMNGPLMKTA